MEDSVQDFYRRNVRLMTAEERKQLAGLILNELSRETHENPKRKGDITNSSACSTVEIQIRPITSVSMPISPALTPTIMRTAVSYPEEAEYVFVY